MNSAINSLRMLRHLTLFKPFRFRFWLCLCCCFLFCSCIHFERQDLYYCHDPATDTLRIFQVYHGIHGDKLQPELTDEERKQFDSVMKTERTFFFANWIFEFNKEGLLKTMEDIEKDTEGSAGSHGTGKNAKNQTAERQMQLKGLALLKELTTNVTVKNGALFEENGKLSGYQLVSVKHVSRLISLANTLLDQVVLTNLAQSDGQKKSGFSKETEGLLLKAARNNHQWITLKDNLITVMLPMTYGDFRKQKNSFFKGVFEELYADTPDKKELDENCRKLSALLSSNMWVSWYDNKLVWRIGSIKDGDVHIGLPVHMESAENALKYAKGNYSVSKEPVNLEAARKRFFASGAK